MECEKMKTEQLELMCYRGEATAEHFEKAIRKNGFTVEITQMMYDYYGNDYVANLKRFPR